MPQIFLQTSQWAMFTWREGCETWRTLWMKTSTKHLDLKPGTYTVERSTSRWYWGLPVGWLKLRGQRHRLQSLQFLLQSLLSFLPTIMVLPNKNILLCLNSHQTLRWVVHLYLTRNCQRPNYIPGEPLRLRTQFGSWQWQFFLLIYDLDDMLKP